MGWIVFCAFEIASADLERDAHVIVVPGVIGFCILVPGLDVAKDVFAMLCQLCRP